ncbi:hypothetical protein GXW77_04530 [Roseomonas alkaliterrae]|uniref:hypothetical protein n=1 Tax=Neoroseomonas alkaliterrae TaxID=1452450 RepID=UPI001BAD33EB|nr:hypothetical protein [Neoroseomonas alkaliterrae]MBR0675436.1 hypothetical protein [Neoroseomonas alkaliterrae]
MTPGLSHALIAGMLTLAVGGLAAALGASPLIGAGFAVGFYVGRERRQSEEWAGSNRIPPWRWKPRALRDVLWSALAAAVVTGLMVLALPARAHTPELSEAENAWLDRQYSRDRTKCCDYRDVHIGRAVEWRIVGGRYQVRIMGEWRDVPPGRILMPRADDPSPWPGEALLFWQPAPHVPGGYWLWCFQPEPLT